MSKTIEQVGVLEPLIVRASSQYRGQFEIIAGERRHKAAKLAGLTQVPCLLSNYSNEQAAQIALIENMSREGLNPIAEALAMERLATEFRYTHLKNNTGLLTRPSKKNGLSARWIMPSRPRGIKNQKRLQKNHLNLVPR